MNEIITTEDMLPATARAVMITERIKSNGRAAVNAVCMIGKDLRTMKIDKLYTSLGYAEFEDYAEKEFQIKRRQAYQYISVYEKLGEEFVQSNAQLGITKLALLAAANPEDRAEVMENEDVSDMTSKELEEALAKCKQQGEQLSMLEEENTELKNAAKGREELEKELEDYRRRCIEQQDKIDALEKEPKDVEIQTKEVIKEVPDKKVEKELAETKKAQKATEKELQEAQEAKNKAEKELAAVKKELEAKTSELQRATAKPAESTDKSSFKQMLASAYKEMTGLIEFVKTSEPEDRELFLRKALEILSACKAALMQIDPCVGVPAESEEDDGEAD